MSESIDNDDKPMSQKSDFVELTNNIAGEVNVKMGIFLFIIGMFLFSDMFINTVLTKFDNAVAGECTTTKGTIVQLTLFIICYLVLDLLMKGKFI